MSLTLIKTPPLVSPAGDMMNFQISSDKKFSQAGSKASLVIELSSYLDEDEEFTLVCEAFPDGEIQLTAKEAPDDSGIQIIAPTAPFPSIPDYIDDELIPSIKWNYDIEDLFEVGRIGDAFKFIAKNKGSLYDITLKGGYTAPISSDVPVAGQDQIANSFFSINVRTRINDAILPSSEIHLPGNDGGVADFFVEKLIKPELSTGFNVDEDIIITKRENIIKPYTIEYFERYGSPPDEYKVYSSNTFYALFGGISKKTQARYNDASTNWWEEAQKNKMFLTWHPRPKKVYPDQPERLYFMNLLTNNIELHVIIEKTDGNKISDDKFLQATPDQYKVYEINTSPENLASYVTGGSALLAAEEIRSFIVYIKQNGGIKSEAFQYVLNYKPAKIRRAFVFQNSLGGFDTFIATGRIQKAAALNRQIYRTYLQPYFKTEDFEVRNIRPNKQEKFSASTGWLNLKHNDGRSMSEYIADFFHSEKVYQIVKGKLLPVVITSQTPVLNKDDNYTFAINFNYEPAYSDEYIEASFGDFSTWGNAGRAHGHGFGDGFN